MPRDGAPTRERILATAERLVIDNGYAATAVDQVIAASGTSKGAFFHHFPTKQALADALVERYVEADLVMLDGGLAAAEAAGDDPRERVIAFLRHYEDLGDEIMTGTTGCLYTSILVERQLMTTGTGAPIERAIVSWRDGFAELLRAALPTSAAADLDDLSDHVFVTFEGAFLLARSTGDASHMRRQLGVVRRLVESVLAAP